MDFLHFCDRPSKKFKKVFSSCSETQMAIPVVYFGQQTHACACASNFPWSKTINNALNYQKNTFFIMRTSGLCKAYV